MARGTVESQRFLMTIVPPLIDVTTIWAGRLTIDAAESSGSGFRPTQELVAPGNNATSRDLLRHDDSCQDCPVGPSRPDQRLNRDEGGQRWSSSFIRHGMQRSASYSDGEQSVHASTR